MVTRHGYGGYVLGCRCGTCVEARRLYNRLWMQTWRARLRYRRHS